MLRVHGWEEGVAVHLVVQRIKSEEPRIGVKRRHLVPGSQSRSGTARGQPSLASQVTLDWRLPCASMQKCEKRR